MRHSYVMLLTCVALSSLFLASPERCRAQVQGNDPVLEDGTKPYGSFGGSSNESVNLLNGKLYLHYPLISFPQRGGKLQMSFSIVYINDLFKITLQDPPNGTCNPDRPSSCQQLLSLSQGGIAIVPEAIPEPLSSASGLFAQLPDMTSHPFRALSSGASYLTVDGSAYTFSEDNNGGQCPTFTNIPVPYFHQIVTDKLGSRYSWSCYSLFTGAQDSNGNQIVGISTVPPGSNPPLPVLTGFTDTVGRLIPLPDAGGQSTNLSGCSASAFTASLWNVPGPGNSTSSYKICATLIYVNLPNCPATSTGRCTTDNTVSYERISDIILPNNTAFRFQYDTANPNDTSVLGGGDLTKITYPTGGSSSFIWGVFNPVCSSVQNLYQGRRVVSRTHNPNDGTTATWAYTTGFPLTPVSTETDPLGNQAIHTFTNLVSGGCGYYETQTQYYQGSSSSGTLLRTDTTQYHSDQLLPEGTNVLPTAKTIAWANGQTSSTQLGYAFDVPLYQTTILASYGNGSPGALLRQTTVAYQYQSASSYQSKDLVSLPATVSIYDGSGVLRAQTTYGYDENNGSPQGTLGNQTSVTQWLNGGTSPKSQTVFNSQGMPSKTIDPNGNPTTFTYDSTGAYLTQAQYPTTGTIQHIEKYSFDANTGLLLSDTDQNNNTTTYKYADSVYRLTEVDFPDGGQTLVSYNDALPSPTKTTSLKLNTQGQLLTVVSVSDGLGRTAQTQLTTDPGGTDYVDTTYDALGRISTQSNPHRSASAPSDGKTTFTYDALGRTCVMAPPTGTPQSSCPSGTIAGDVVTVYAGRASEVSDEGNGTQSVARISQIDALGRLTSVCEVAPGPFVGANGASSSYLIGSGGTPAACAQDIAGTGFLTTYQYDTLDNLLQVNQAGVINRTYSYNTLSELLSVSNPETGTICYGTVSAGVCHGNGYDATGNLVTKTDARGITTTLHYDALNRILSKTFTDSTPSITNTYDVAVDGLAVQYPIGRLVKSATSNTATVNSYDKMGRVATQWQCTPQNCGTGYFPLVYTYDLIGDVTSATNGVGVTFTYAFDTAAQLTNLTSSLSDSNHPGTLLSNPAYNPDGEITSVLLGNQITETAAYNSRLFLTSYSAGSVYSFNVTSYAPNGSALSTSDGVNGNWAYTYDQFNRLTNANQNSGQALYNYVYDRFGNRWQQNGPHSMQLAFTGNNPSNPQNNNRMDGYSYDLAGNLLNDGTTTYTYDAENRTTSASNSSNGTSTYVYDALGRRVRKTTTAKGTVDLLYDLNDDENTELSATGSWNRVEIHAQGRHVATYTPTATYFNYTDSLGTERARTNLTGGLSETCTSLPFGDWLNCSATDTSPMHFTGEERDSETGLDHFDHRKLASFMGRWTSPDLLPGDISDPQSLNRYAYAHNNPANLTDLLGLQDTFRGCVTLDENGNPAPCPTGPDINNLPLTNTNSDLSAAMQLSPQPSSDTAGLPSASLTDLSSLLTLGVGSGSDSSSSSTLGTIQTGLDLLGVIPVVGDFTNAASGVISLAQGHYAAAALSFASAIPLFGTAGEIIKIGRLGEEGVQGFKTFRAFKKFYGAAEETKQWHHIVEQGGGRIARFGPEAIHNVENLVQVPTEIHRQISGFYSSVQEGLSEGKTVRQWLKTKSFEEQYQFGKQVMKRFGI